MRTPVQILPLVSLITLASMLVPAMPVRAASEATITVNKTNDELNSDGDCSLREAVRAANTNHPVDACLGGGSGTDTIILPVGTYQLSIAGANEDSAATGDLDITGNLVIQGAGRDLSVIDGNALDRVFHIIGMNVVVEISHLTIQNGRAPINETNQLGGGGILQQNGVLTLREVSILDNYSEGVGGGITNVSPIIAEYSLKLIDSSVSENHGVAGGGIYNSGTLSIIGSTLSANSATETGGGLDDSYSVTLENVTISGNASEKGGGIFSDGDVNIRHSSVLYNSASDLSYGGNIHSGNLFYFYNTLVANSQSGPNCSGSGLNSLGYNLEGQSAEQYTCGFNRNYIDPLVDPLLADNGGPTLTHALLPGSPAIDGGDELYCAEKDQRGHFRPYDGDGDGVAICDIGAFEYFVTIYVFIPMAWR